MSKLTYEELRQLDALYQMTVSLVFAHRGESGVRVISPPDWKSKAEQSPQIRFADPHRRREAMRILQSENAEPALKRLIVAAGGELPLRVFLRAIDICVDDLTMKRVTRREAKKIVAAIGTIKRFAPIMLDPSWAGLLKDFERNAQSKRIPGRAPRSVADELAAYFRKVFRRPVHDAVADLLRATNPGRGHETKNVTTSLSRRKKKIR